jgi:hypothetical protein
MPTTLNTNVTERLHAMAMLIDAIGNIHDAGLISHERAFEKVNYCLDHIEEVIKLDENMSSCEN